MLTKIRQGFVLAIVIVVALALVQAYGEDSSDVPDINENDRLVQIRYYANGGSREKPIRFNIDGGFSGGVDFREEDKRDGHRKTGTTVKGTVAWSKMYVHVYSPIPTRMWCEVWQGKVNITYSQDIYPEGEDPIAYCAGRVH